ncbi:MAG TPA: DUF456 domain-containing protein [Bacillota bacterium]|nr:DUF456 domain-containing protein [Bacillota bacterium]
MTAEQVIGLALALLVMLLGVVGSIMPGLPGTPLILAAAIAHRLYFGSASIHIWGLVILVLLTLLSMLFDYLAGIVGAKQFGATWRGVLGAGLGGLAGLFFSIPGILLGPFVGATLFELFGGRKFKEATHAGLGATLGLILGSVGKLALGVAMLSLFIVSVLAHSR